MPFYKNEENTVELAWALQWHPQETIFKVHVGRCALVLKNSISKYVHRDRNIKNYA